MISHVQTSKRNPTGNKATLVKATLESIYEDGIADTTVSKIIARAGLSRGMIHLHFGGKSQLLAAAAEAYSDDYYAGLDRYLQQAGNEPQDIVMAVITADLSETLLNERSAKILHALRGAAASDAAIARFSSTRDNGLRNTLRSAFEEIARTYEAESSSVLARDATFGLLALLEGMWVDYLANSNEFSRDVAKHIACRFLKGLFPNHF